MAGTIVTSNRSDVPGVRGNSSTLLTRLRERAGSRVALLLFGIFLVGLGLRLYCLDCASLWYDEVTVLEWAQDGLWAMPNPSTFLYNLVTWLTLQPVDPASTSLLVRLPSALAGSLTSLLVYGVGQELFGRAQGLLAAILSALSTVLLDYSQEARTYAVLTTLAASLILCLLKVERTNSLRWWLLSAIAAGAMSLYSNVAITVVLPTISLYVFWLVWKLWLPPRYRRARLFIAVPLFLLLLALFSLILTNTGRGLPALGQVTPGTFSIQAARAIGFYTRFGTPAEWQPFVQWGLGLLALIGVAGGIVAGRARGVFLCLLFLIVPSIALALSSTSTTVFQRYALFSILFFFLLVANGALFPDRAAYRGRIKGLGRAMLKGSSVAVALFIALLFTVGAYNYSKHDETGKLSNRPDFRGAAAYLAQRALSSDTILFVDDPGLGLTVSGFYWRGNPPATTFDVRDPRLYNRQLDKSGTLYWVFGTQDTPLLSYLSAPDRGWREVISFRDVVILRERPQVGGIPHAIERIVEQIESFGPQMKGYQPVKTLRGCILQGRGDVAGAAAAYDMAGRFFNLGAGFLNAARLYEARGDDERAWREAVKSKFMEPNSVELHRWFSRKLLEAGMVAESRIEAQIAEALEK